MLLKKGQGTWVKEYQLNIQRRSLKRVKLEILNKMHNKICATREDCLFGQKKFVPQEKTVSLGKKNLCHKRRLSLWAKKNLYKNPVPDMARGGTVEKFEKIGENFKKNRMEYQKQK